MEAASAESWVTIRAAEVDVLRDEIRHQKGQLALALGVLLSLGFDLEYFLAVVT